MSERQIGRSPFAVIAEAASVTVLSFYIYMYFFYQGFMSGIDDHYLALFSFKDLVNFAPRFAVVSIINFPIAAALAWAAIKATRYNRYIPSIVGVFFLFAPLIRVFTQASPEGVSRFAFAKLTADGLWTCVGFILLFIALSATHRYARIMRLSAYGVILFTVGLNAHSNGFRLMWFAQREEPSYCVEGPDKALTARLLISGDRNILLRLASGELRAVPFGAIRSISDRACQPDKSPAAKTQ